MGRAATLSFRAALVRAALFSVLCFSVHPSAAEAQLHPEEGRLSVGVFGTAGVGGGANVDAVVQELSFDVDPSFGGGLFVDYVQTWFFTVGGRLGVATWTVDGADGEVIGFDLTFVPKLRYPFTSLREEGFELSVYVITPLGLVLGDSPSLAGYDLGFGNGYQAGAFGGVELRVGVFGVFMEVGYFSRWLTHTVELDMEVEGVRGNGLPVTVQAHQPAVFAGVSLAL